MKKHKIPTNLIISLILIITLTASSYATYLYAKRVYRYIISQHYANVITNKNAAGMLDKYTTECYQNTILLADPKGADYNHDIKFVYRDAQKTRLADCAHGVVMDFEPYTGFDFSNSVSGTIATNNGWSAYISRDYSPYPDTMEYLEHYYNRFMLSPEFQSNNRITMHENTTRRIGDYDMRIISLTRTPYEGSDITLNSYTYAYIIDPQHSQEFIRIMIKSEIYNPAQIDTTLSSLQITDKKGELAYVVDTSPILPEWNAETAAFYESFKNRTDVMWGVYSHKQLDPSGMNPKIYELEEKLDYKFPLVMGYAYLDQNPLKGMNEAYEAGKAIEMTLQICTVDNMGLDSAENPNFQLLDGQKDDMVREFARNMKAYGHPIIFRLNNEMNTDWTSYSGVVTLCDPDIYKQVHSRIFEIFKEEGADNIIWAFNPQYGNYPPASFNNYLNYYPGNSQIQMLGVTAYNTGNYYINETNEQWRSFDTLYSKLNDLYIGHFDNMPWIITEFSCSSIGGNKANWIRNMFMDIKKYPNIKAAVWYNFADYDPNKNGVISRPYYLDETPETVEAFKDGVHGNVITQRLPE